MRSIPLILVLIFALMAASCKEKRELVKIKTEHGDMLVWLYDTTSQHKQNFLKLAKEGFYDSLLFHRVINEFMIQGGDPDSKNAEAGKQLGGGGPGYTIPAEFNPNLFHKKGALSAARMGDEQNPEKESSGSQFYIVQGKVYPQDQLQGMEEQMNQQAMYGVLTEIMQAEPEIEQQIRELQEKGDQEALNNYLQELEPRLQAELEKRGNSGFSQEQLEAYSTVGGTPQLDRNYTVFGQVIDGLDVIDKIAAVETGQADRPKEDVRMEMEIVEMTLDELEDKYGFVPPSANVEKKK